MKRKNYEEGNDNNIVNTIITDGNNNNAAMAAVLLQEQPKTKRRLPKKTKVKKMGRKEIDCIKQECQQCMSPPTVNVPSPRQSVDKKNLSKNNCVWQKNQIGIIVIKY